MNDLQKEFLEKLATMRNILKQELKYAPVQTVTDILYLFYLKDVEQLGFFRRWLLRLFLSEKRAKTNIKNIPNRSQLLNNAIDRYSLLVSETIFQTVGWSASQEYLDLLEETADLANQILEKAKTCTPS